MRRRARLPDARAGGGAARRHAPVQVRRQPDPHPGGERAGRHLAVGVALGLPGLPGRLARPDPLRAELRRVRLRHRDPDPADRVGAAHQRGADPHLLRGRDLLRERPALRSRRHARRAALPGPQDGPRQRPDRVPPARPTSGRRAPGRATASSSRGWPRGRPDGSSTSAARAASWPAGCASSATA